jgi:hypothetical protein
LVESGFFFVEGFNGGFFGGGSSLEFGLDFGLEVLQ